MKFANPSTYLRACAASLVGLALLCATSLTSCADDAAEKPAAAAEKPAETEKPAAEVDPFAVPEGTDSAELKAFMQKLSQTPPQDRTPEGLKTFFNNLDKAFSEILTRDVEDEIATTAAGARSQILTILADRLGDESAAERLKTFTASLQKDERPALAAIGKSLALQQRISGITELKSEERAALIQEVADSLSAKEVDRSAIGAAMGIAEALEDESPEEAAAALNLFAKYIEAREGGELKSIAKSMRGSARRLGLVGNVMEVKGPTLDGHSFDIADWKGKVVLVDFWATWCGPCIGELPNVLSLYETYHDKGFEVVGISLDDDVEELKSFIAKRKLPWTTIFESDAEKQGWNNPLARHYGISGIPTAILIDQEGKVITLSARGNRLKVELEKLLGPVEESKPENKPDDAPTEKE
ncbi:MAG: TlpA disulfide reductase family protein [Planctomycetaceae bacterium]